MITIGVLALQGSVIEHIKKLKLIDNVQPLAVKTKDDLSKIDAIILPGGESTTIAKLLKEFELFNLLKSRIQNGLPVWGTCAGMILLAKEIIGDEPHLSVMDIKVKRNSYGRQSSSFIKTIVIPEISKDPIDLVFIRAPWINEVKKNVNVLCSLDGHIIAARQDNMLVTSFHPELTDSLTLHEYFLSMVKENIS